MGKMNPDYRKACIEYAAKCVESLGEYVVDFEKDSLNRLYFLNAGGLTAWLSYCAANAGKIQTSKSPAICFGLGLVVLLLYMLVLSYKVNTHMTKIDDRYSELIKCQNDDFQKKYEEFESTNKKHSKGSLFLLALSILSGAFFCLGLYLGSVEILNK
jgi:hypothetical protein